MAKVYAEVSPVARVIHLELTEQEALVLKALVGNVIGTVTGLRGVADSIYDALKEVVTTEPPRLSGTVESR